LECEFTGIKNGVEKSTPFFCADDSAEKGFFYSVNVQIEGRVAFCASR